MDIRPPKKRLLSANVPPRVPQTTTQPPAQSIAPVVPPSSPVAPKSTPPVQKPEKRRRLWLWIPVGLIVFLAAVAMGIFMWYRLSLHPVNSSDTSKVRVTINTGDSPSSIESTLKNDHLIRSTLAFEIYTRLTGTRAKLQAGVYSFSPSDSLPSIIDKMVGGKVDQFEITFLPGATIAQDKDALVKSGYSQAEVDAAFSKQYDHPLFATKPVSADLEGYVYGETYKFDSDATVQQILTKTFDEFYSTITADNLVSGFQKQGLTLYQGITLASIIQREVSNPDDQRQVAQIFLKRLAVGMPLGSDVTYHYAAQKLGVAPSPTLDSPYNTRIYPGLPPGPIAVPGRMALDAVANPAPGDYLFFLSGDDGKTYYATTEAEHQANIANHCQIKCVTP